MSLSSVASLDCRQVDKRRDHLINYIIFLRITPFLPNWFINITSPVINVPLWPFFIGTFLGKTANGSFFLAPVLFFCCCCCCSSTSSPVFRRLVYRSGPAVVCRDQCGHHSVQADHSRRGRVLEFPGGARHSGSALHLARLLQEEAGVEPRRPRHPVSSSIPSAQEHAAVSTGALPPSRVQLMVEEFLASCVIGQSVMTNVFRGGWSWMLKVAGDVFCFFLAVCQKFFVFFNLRYVFYH